MKLRAELLWLSPSKNKQVTSYSQHRDRQLGASSVQPPRIFCPVVWGGVTTQLLTFVGMTSPRPAYPFFFLFFFLACPGTPPTGSVATGSLELQLGYQVSNPQEGAGRWRAKWANRARAERFVCSENTFATQQKSSHLGGKNAHTIMFWGIVCCMKIFP